MKSLLQLVKVGTSVLFLLQATTEISVSISKSNPYPSPPQKLNTLPFSYRNPSICHSHHRCKGIRLLATMTMPELPSATSSTVHDSSRHVGASSSTGMNRPARRPLLAPAKKRCRRRHPMAASRVDCASSSCENTAPLLNNASEAAAPALLKEQQPSSTPPTTRTTGIGNIVTVEFELRGENDYIPEPLFDCEGTASFALGWGNYLPGLHDLILGMDEGQQVHNVSIDAGWGERNPNLVAVVDKKKAVGIEPEESKDKKIEVGTKMHLKSGQLCQVTHVTDTTFTIDCNPPLAGASYNCNVKLIKVEDSPIPGTLLDVSRSSDLLSYRDTDNSECNDVRIVGLKRRYEVATFGLGCFWGGELAYMRENGVVGTRVGYSQGNVDHPTYDMVCSGDTNHAESIQVIYDPTIVSYERLVDIAIERLGDSMFLINQVGNDIGTQYRSGLFYHTPQQEDVARKLVEKYGEICHVEVAPAADVFWPAEDYHQQYLLKGGQSARKGEEETIRCYG